MRNKTENFDRIMGGLDRISCLTEEVNQLKNQLAADRSFRRTGYVVHVNWRDGSGEACYDKREFAELRLAAHWRDSRLNELDSEGKESLTWRINENRTRGVNDEGKPRNLITFSNWGIGTTMTDLMEAYDDPS